MDHKQLKFDQISGDADYPTGYTSIIVPVKLRDKNRFRYLLGCPLEELFKNDSILNQISPICFDNFKNEGVNINFCITGNNYDPNFIKKIKHFENLDVFLLRSIVRLKDENEFDSLDSILGEIFIQYMQKYNSFLESMTKNSEGIIIENQKTRDKDVIPIDFKFRMDDIPGWNLN